MSVFMMREIDRLKKSILSLSAHVEEAVNRSVRAVTERDNELANKVIEGDAEIDAKEVEVEEECLKILALHQPVASDLRYIIAVLKMNNDLERMGDLAVGISRNALRLAKMNAKTISLDVQPMAEKVRSMLKNSLDALVNLDVELAQNVLVTDKEVDALNRALYAEAVESAQPDREERDCIQRQISIARNLERIADHATNVCEDVIYLVQGDIVRHSRRGATPKPA
jgi:phosphate transport system protein